jgi:hypothetical protein
LAAFYDHVPWLTIPQLAKLLDELLVLCLHSQPDVFRQEEAGVFLAMVLQADDITAWELVF